MQRILLDVLISFQMMSWLLCNAKPTDWTDALEATSCNSNLLKSLRSVVGKVSKEPYPTDTDLSELLNSLQGQ